MSERVFDRVSENGEILPLKYEKLDISLLINAIKHILSDYELYIGENIVRIKDQISNEEKYNTSQIILERLIVESLNFRARNGEIGYLTIEIQEFCVDRYSKKLDIVLNAFFTINNIKRRSKINIIIDLDSSNISINIKSFLINEFSNLGIGTDIMKILIEISKQTKLNLSVIPSKEALSFYKKNGFDTWLDIRYLREYWKTY